MINEAPLVETERAMNLTNENKYNNRQLNYYEQQYKLYYEGLNSQRLKLLLKGSRFDLEDMRIRFKSRNNVNKIVQYRE
jgi:hypothetical protein